MKIKVQYLIFLILALTYIMFGYGVTISNDSVTNVEQIVGMDLWSRSSHFSFHLFGILFYLIFSKLLGLSAIASVEIMLAIFSAAGAFSLYKITLSKFNNVKQALITVAIYAFISGIFRFSCQIEYLILVPSFGLISLYFYSKGQYFISGIVFGFGLLTSVLVLLFLPTFLLFTSFKRFFKKENLIFAISMVSLFLVINAFTYRETVSGHWSYGGEVTYYKGIWSEINHLRIASIYIYGYLRSFNIIIILLPFVLYFLYKSNKELFFVFIITILIHLPLALPEARYGGYQMTAYPIMALSVGYFLNNLLIKRRYMVYFIIMLYTLINLFIVFSERAFFIDLKETYVQMNNKLKGKSILITYQANKPIEKLYAPNLQVTGLLSDYQTKMAKTMPGFVPTDLNEILNKNDVVYLLESGQSMPDDHFKLLVNQFTKNQGAKVKGFALEKILTMNLPLQVEKLEEYPLDVYRLTKRNNE